MNAQAPFAATQARLNAAVQRRLANAVAVWQDGDPFGVVFDRQPHDAMSEVGLYGTTCGLRLADAPDIAQGSHLTVGGLVWSVIDPVEPDSSGWAVLRLREASHG